MIVFSNRTMAQTHQRVNKTRNIDDYVDLRHTFKAKQTKNLNKHKKSVYGLMNVIEDDIGEDDEDPYRDLDDYYEDDEYDNE